MDSKRITIRMPKPLLDSWLAALRSGEYGQCVGSLCIDNRSGDAYCCLGVMQMVAGGDVERYDDDVPRAMPSLEWLAAHSVQFVGQEGHSATDPILPSLDKYASTANDYGATFAVLADAIEACAEGF